MPASYLSKHRPICSVLEEILDIAKQRDDQVMIDLAEEAITYAKKMSLKLSEYKNKQEQIEDLDIHR